MNVKRIDFAINSKRPTPVDLIIGANIRRVRRTAKLTLEDLARLVDISMQQLQKYETGTSRVSGGMIVKLASQLGVPITNFFPPTQAWNFVLGADTEGLVDLQRELIEAASTLSADKLQAVIAMTKALSS